MDRTTVRMSPGLKAQLEDIARSEGTSFTELMEEGAQHVVRTRQAGRRRRKPVDLPTVGDPNGPKITMEDIRKAVELADLEQLRNSGMLKDVPPAGR